MNPPSSPVTKHPRMRVQAFLDELTELSRRTGIVISGCRHCDSPRLLVDGQPWPWSPEGSYVVNYKPDADPWDYTFPFARVRWLPNAAENRIEDEHHEGLEDAPSLLPVDRQSVRSTTTQ